MNAGYLPEKFLFLKNERGAPQDFVNHVGRALFTPNAESST
jgi:hypothetical protein